MVSPAHAVASNTVSVNPFKQVDFTRAVEPSMALFLLSDVE